MDQSTTYGHGSITQQPSHRLYFVFCLKTASIIRSLVTVMSQAPYGRIFGVPVFCGEKRLNFKYSEAPVNTRQHPAIAAGAPKDTGKYVSLGSKTLYCISFLINIHILCFFITYTLNAPLPCYLCIDKVFKPMLILYAVRPEPLPVLPL